MGISAVSCSGRVDLSPSPPARPSPAKPPVKFPGGFSWGVATSAYQIEGAVAADGRGRSIWDTFCERPGTIADGSSGAVACDHYHRWESDLDLVKSLGLALTAFPLLGLASCPRAVAASIGAAWISMTGSWMGCSTVASRL